MTVWRARQCANVLTSMHVRWSGIVQPSLICELSHKSETTVRNPPTLAYPFKLSRKTPQAGSPQMPEHFPSRLRQGGKLRGKGMNIYTRAVAREVS